jgi:putative transcriptional regulator
MVDTIKCPFCGNLNVETKSGQSHHFTESGLDNVYLKNVETSHCPDCNANSVSIPKSPQLLNCLGEAIVFSPGRLTGAEIRFLRKNLRININDFAKLLRVSRATVSRWENGQIETPKPLDLLVRSIYILKGPGIKNEVRDEFKKLLEKQLVKKHPARKPKRITLRLPLDHFSCAPALACS